MGVVGLTYLGGFGLAGWVAGRLLATSAGLIDAVVDQAEAAARAVDLIERHAVPTLGRIALALENLRPPGRRPAPDDGRPGRRRRPAGRSPRADGRRPTGWSGRSSATSRAPRPPGSWPSWTTPGTGPSTTSAPGSTRPEGRRRGPAAWSTSATR